MNTDESESSLAPLKLSSRWLEIYGRRSKEYNYALIIYKVAPVKSFFKLIRSITSDRFKCPFIIPDDQRTK